MSDGAPADGMRALWADAFRVQRRGVDPLAGLAGAIASCAPVAIGIATGHAEIGVTACFGGLNGALGVPRGPLRERLGWGLAAALGCLVAVALATLAQPSVAASVLLALAVVALATSLRTFGPNGGLTGFVTGAIYTITNGIPAGSLDVGARTGWFALGSLLGLVLMVPALAPSSPPASGTQTPLATVLADGARRLAATFRGDAALRAHALRLATLVAVTTLLYRVVDLSHGYWVPLTVLAVLQPDERASRVRALQRGAGTLVGTVVIALLTIATGAQWVLIAGQGVAAFGLFALYARGYFWLVVMLTPTALLTVSAVDYQGAGIALARGGTSAAGIAIGLAIGELFWHLGPRLPARTRTWLP